jgi:hypothetical protein
MPPSDACSERRGLAQLDRLELPALCISYALGTCSSGAKPPGVATIVKAGSPSTTQVGWLASGELLATAISVLAMSRRPSCRSTPMAALRVCLRNSIQKGRRPSRKSHAGRTQLLKHDTDLGSVTVGKLAHLIAVSGNPLDDIGLMKHITFVMKDGL